MTTISYSLAAEALKAAMTAAGSPSSVTLLDAGGNPLAFARMDGAPLASIEVSRGKAFSAVAMGMPSGDLMGYVQPGAPFYGFQTTHGGLPVLFAGGLPIRLQGVLVGSIGVAGGSLEQDEAAAKAGLAAILAHAG